MHQYDLCAQFQIFKIRQYVFVTFSILDLLCSALTVIGVCMAI